MDLNTDGKRLKTEHPDFKKLEKEIEDAIFEFDTRYDEIMAQHEGNGRAIAYYAAPLHKEFSRKIDAIRAKYEYLYE
jgi:hypothetical protein